MAKMTIEKLAKRVVATEKALECQKEGRCEVTVMVKVWSPYYGCLQLTITCSRCGRERQGEFEATREGMKRLYAFLSV